MPQYWEGGRTRHFFLLIFYNFKNIGGGARAPPGPPTPRSLKNTPAGLKYPISVVDRGRTHRYFAENDADDLFEQK